MLTTKSISDSLSVRAQRILKFAQRGAQPVAMSSPPTQTIGTSATITGGTTVAFTDAKLSYLGTVYNTVLTPGNIAGSGHTDQTLVGAGFREGGPWSVAFSTDALAFEWRTYATGGSFRIFVNGQAVSLTPTVFASTFADTYVKLTFATAVPRDIRIEMDHLAVVNSIAVAANYSVWKTSLDDMRCMIVGDSYVNSAYGDGTTNNFLGLATQVGYNLGVRDWFVSGSSGEGYLKTGNQSGKTLRGRSVTDIVAYAPKYVMLAYGINDYNLSASALQTEVTTLYSGLLAALPNTIFTVVAPFRAPTQATPTAIFDAVKAGVAAQPEYSASNTGRIAYIDTLSENWQQGTGKVGATSGTGNSNIYIGADGLHPVQAGHDYLASRVTEAAIRHLMALA